MKALRVATVIAIAFLLPLLANMTVRIWAEPPEYMDYSAYYPPEPKTAEERQAAEQETRKKLDAYDKAVAEFNLQLFYASFPLGLLELIGAFALRRKATLAVGMFLGALATIAFTSYTGWETLPGSLRYASLLLTLLVLAVLAMLLDREASHPPPPTQPA